jgi:hypothetical protein
VTAATAPTSRQRRARELRRRIDEAPDHQLVLPRAELLALLPAPALNGDAQLGVTGGRYAQSLLAQHGVRVFPSLTAAASDAVRLEQTPAYALQGAVAVALPAVLVGLREYWAYGLIFLVTGVIAVALVGLGFDALQRRSPDWLPTGRLLGAAVALALLVVATVVFALPIRNARADDHGAGRAKALVTAADKEVDAGHFAAAQQLLAAAKRANPHPVLFEDVRAHLIAARFQQTLIERDRRRHGG